MSMVQNENKLKKNFTGLMGWVDERFPATETFEYHMSRYPAPRILIFSTLWGASDVVFVMY